MTNKSHTLNVSISEVAEVLKNEYEPRELTQIAAGMYSVAFSFTSIDTKYVVRVASKEGDFRRDLYIWNEYGKSVSTPEIFSVGKFRNDGYYAVSRHVEGIPLASDGVLAKEARVGEILKESFADRLLGISKITAKGTGYGKIHDNGEGDYGSMRAVYNSSWIRSRSEEFDKYVADGFLDRVLFEEAQSALDKYSKNAYETRHLVHGDYQTANVVMRDGGIVAVLDWGNASWGDFAQDIAWTSMHPPIITDEKYLVDFYADNGMDMTNIRIRIVAAKIYTLIVWAMWSTGLEKHTWANDNQQDLIKLLKKSS